MVGFNRFIRLEWLDKAVEIYSVERDESKSRQELREYLKGELESEKHANNVLKVLMRTWVNVPDDCVELRDRALSLYKSAGGNERIMLHWCMLMLAYPIFVDIIKVVGRLLNLQDSFTLKMVKNRIYEIWGERSTVKYAVGKILGSMAQWGVLERQNKPGLYKRTASIKIEDTHFKHFFLECYLKAHNRPYVNYYEVNRLYEAFPFDIEFGICDFHKSDVLKLNRMGNELVILL